MTVEDKLIVFFHFLLLAELTDVFCNSFVLLFCHKQLILDDSLSALDYQTDLNLR